MEVERYMAGLGAAQLAVFRAVVLERRSVFFTGSAGTGKSFLLRRMLDALRVGGLTVGATAATGIAAVNIEGCTLHSFLGAGLAKGEPAKVVGRLRRNKRIVERWRDLDVLVIDELSMIQAQFLDMVDTAARALRDSEEPFGGIQVVMCGDFLQLPPVVTEEDGPGPVFAFEAQSFETAVGTSLFELDAPFRQHADPAFFSLLQAIRFDDVDEQGAALLRSRVFAWDEIRALETRDGARYSAELAEFADRVVSDTRRRVVAAQRAIGVLKAMRAGAPVHVGDQTLDAETERLMMAMNDGRSVCAVEGEGRHDERPACLEDALRIGTPNYLVEHSEAPVRPPRCLLAEVQKLRHVKAVAARLVETLTEDRIDLFQSPLVLFDGGQEMAKRHIAQLATALDKGGLADALSYLPAISLVPFDEKSHATYVVSLPGSPRSVFSAVRLYPTRKQVEVENESVLQELARKLEDVHVDGVGDARIIAVEGSASPELQDKFKSINAPVSVRLCIGAQVLLTKNMTERLVNGSRGRVVAIKRKEGSTGHSAIMEKAEEYKFALGPATQPRQGELLASDVVVTVVFDDIASAETKITTSIGCEPWEVNDGEKVIAARFQIPLIPAYALSIHKCQGLSLDSIVVSFQGVFHREQVYTALSRCRSLAGIHILRPGGKGPAGESWLAAIGAAGCVASDPKCQAFHRMITARAQAEPPVIEVEDVPATPPQLSPPSPKRSPADGTPEIFTRRKAFRLSDYPVTARHSVDRIRASLLRLTGSLDADSYKRLSQERARGTADASTQTVSEQKIVAPAATPRAHPSQAINIYRPHPVPHVEGGYSQAVQAAGYVPPYSPFGQNTQAFPY